MKKQKAFMKHQSRSFQQLALCLLSSGRSQELGDMASQMGDHHDSPYYLALKLAQEQRLEEALDLLRPLTTKGHPESRQLAFRLLIHRANGHFSRQEHGDLSPVLDEALGLMGDDPEALKELSTLQEILPFCYLRLNRRPEAEEKWRRDFWEYGHAGLHRLALLCYWGSRDVEARLPQEGPGELRELEALWRKTIAFWVALAVSEEFWQEWGQSREKVYGVEVSSQDLEDLRKNILEDLLARRFYYYLDKYQQAGREGHARRHRQYLSLLRLECQAASAWLKLLPQLSQVERTLGIHLSGGVSLQKLVRSLQKAAGQNHCFGENDGGDCPPCEWQELCRQNRLATEGTVHLEFFGGPLMGREMGLDLIVQQILQLHLDKTAGDELAEKLSDYLSPWGLVAIFLEERVPGEALRELEGLSIEQMRQPQARYLEAAAWAEQGRLRLETHGLDPAMEVWQKAKTLILEMKRLNAPMVYRRVLRLEEEMGEWVAEGCIREARAIHKEGRTDEAIRLLQKGLEIVANDRMKDQLADLYCEKGFACLAKDQYSQARQEFEKALSVKSGFLRAKEGISTTYNNEGVQAHDSGRLDEAIRLQKKALEFNPNNRVSRKNLGGALNALGVKKIDVEVPRAYSRERKLSLLREALALFKEAHEYDPSNESVISNHNKLLDILGNIPRW